MALEGVGPAVGCGLVPPADLGHQAPTPVVHLAEALLPACLEAIVRAGGEIVEEPRPIDERGLFARFRDLDGNVWGLWAPAGSSQSDS